MISTFTEIFVLLLVLVLERFLLLRHFWLRLACVGVEAAHEITFFVVRQAEINFPRQPVVRQRTKLQPHGVTVVKIVLLHRARVILPTQRNLGRLVRVGGHVERLTGKRFGLGTGETDEHAELHRPVGAGPQGQGAIGRKIRALDDEIICMNPAGHRRIRQIRHRVQVQRPIGIACRRRDGRGFGCRLGRFDCIGLRRSIMRHLARMNDRRPINHSCHRRHKTKN